eukprot:SAG22_NODE_1181_length_5234_cov_12.279455_3_plen_106_part_00
MCVVCVLPSSSSSSSSLGLPHCQAVKANRVEARFPICTMDLMATVLDILGMPSFEGRPLDGTSLLPILKAEITDRPVAHGIGIHVRATLHGPLSLLAVCLWSMTC